MRHTSIQSSPHLYSVPTYSYTFRLMFNLCICSCDYHRPGSALSRILNHSVCMFTQLREFCPSILNSVVISYRLCPYLRSINGTCLHFFGSILNSPHHSSFVYCTRSFIHSANIHRHIHCIVYLFNCIFI